MKLFEFFRGEVDNVVSQLKEKLKFKAMAVAIHLSLSLMIFFVILYFILYEWYPEPFFTAQGGWQGIRLMAFVDLVLGPSMTLIVFNHLKQRKEIVFDLSIIAAIQIAALVLGGHTVYTQRPIALVYWTSAFYTVTEADYHAQGINSPEFSQYSNYTPPLIYSRPVSTQAELESSRELTEQLIPAYAHVEFYEKVEDNLEAIFYNEVDISEIMFTNQLMSDQIEEVTMGELEDYKYLPLKAKFHNMILIMKDSGELIGSVKSPSHR